MNSVLFIEYPKCSTCKKAKKWLDEHNVSYTDRDIVQDNPTAEELQTWHEESGLPLRRFFNTSGMLYRELNIKDKLNAGMSDAQSYGLLATNGMLVKRPLLIGDGFVIPGFKEVQWLEALGLEEQEQQARSKQLRFYTAYEKEKCHPIESGGIFFVAAVY